MRTIYASSASAFRACVYGPEVIAQHAGTVEVLPSEGAAHVAVLCRSRARMGMSLSSSRIDRPRRAHLVEASVPAGLDRWHVFVNVQPPGLFRLRQIF